MRDIHGLLNDATATAALARMNFNDVRSAATALWKSAGADFDGKNISLLRDGKWKVLHSDMNRALERFMGGHPNVPAHRVA